MRTSPVHYIAPSAISITPNANNSQRDIAVYIARDTKIKVRCPRAGIGTDDDGSYQEWTLTGRNRRLADETGSVPYTIYARLNKSGEKTGYLVFVKKRLREEVWNDAYSSLTLDDKQTDGYSVLYTDNGFDVKVKSPDYYYVRLGNVTTAENGQRTVTFDTGILGTDEYNNEWQMNPDMLPLRIGLGCTVNDEDVGMNPYVYWGQSLQLTATLTEGWSGTDIKRFHHWEIARKTDSDPQENRYWLDGDMRKEAFGKTGEITLRHLRNADDFNWAVATTFTVMAMEANPDYEEDSGLEQYLVLKTATINILAETVEEYKLALSDNIVSYSPQTGDYTPGANVTVGISATNQRGEVLNLTKGEVGNLALSVKYAPIGADSETTVPFPGAQDAIAVGTIPVSTAFASQKSVNVRLVRTVTIAAVEENEEPQTEEIEINHTTIAFVRDGEDSKVREWIYTRRTEPTTFSGSTGANALPSLITQGEVNPGGVADGDVEYANNIDEWVPNGWNDDPQGTGETYSFEYAAYRDYIHEDDEGNDSGGHWGPFSTPRPWSHYGKDGKSALVIDIDNDSDQFGTDSDGKVLVTQTRTTHVTMLYGTEEQAFLIAPPVAPTAFLFYDDGSSVPNIVATASINPVPDTDNKKYLVTVTINATDNNTPIFGKNGHTGLYVDITGSCAKGGPKTIRFSLAKVMGGARGENPVIWQLNPSRKSFVFGRDASNNLTPPYVESNIYVTSTEGNTTTEHTSTSGLTNPPTFSWGFDDETTAQATAQAIGTPIRINNTQDASHSSVWVKLSTGDRETLPILKDGAKGEHGIDAQDIEWAYIRTKGNTPPRIADSSGTDSKGNELTDDDYMPSAYIESTVAGGIEANDISSSDHPNTYGSNNYICGECTDDPNGVSDEWPYEWEIKREKGPVDADGRRSWTAYGDKMTLHNSMVNSIKSANVWYALTQSATTTPADSAYTLDDFPTTLNAGYYVWQATKVVLSDGSSAMTAKMCLGPTTDFLSGTEVYAISTSNETPPAENTTNWKTTYTKTKGYYLWTATRVQYTNGTYAYLNKKCVGYWGEDGNGIASVARTYAISSQATTASDTTPPSDVTTWAAASPATTKEKPYLWAKEVVTYTKAASTTKYYMIGARGQNGIDAQDIEWAYIRTKGNTPPRIADSSGTDSNGNELTDDDYLPSAYIESAVAGGIEANNINSSDHPSTYGSNNYICGECTDDPSGVNDEWPYEWEIKREKGPVEADGRRSWTAYGGKMTLHNNLASSALVIDIDNDNDQFGVDADGEVLVQQARSTVVSMAYGTEPQAFTAAPTASLRYDDGTPVPTSVATPDVSDVSPSDAANTQYRVTVTVYKTTDSNTPVFGKNGHTGLYVDISGTCAKGGPKTIRFSLEKVMSGQPGVSPTIWQLNPSRKSFVFGRDASNNLTPPNVASSIYVTSTEGNDTTEHTSTIGLTNPPTFSWGFDSESTAQASGQAIGDAINISNTQAASHSSVWVKLSTGDRETLPILKDGAKGEDGANADYIYLRGTGNNNPGNRLVYISSQINQSSYQGSGRGIEIVTVSRNSLAKVESQKFDTYGGTDSGHDNQTAACNAAATYLNSLDNTVFVCITSLDAIGWNDNLIAALKNFGLGDLAYSTQKGRYPFAFLGYKGLQEGYALWQIHGTEATAPHSEVSAYIANGLFMSSKDGETTPVYSLVLDHTSIDFRSDATGSFLQQNKSVECTVRKREGSDSETAVSQSGGTYDGYYLRCRRVYRNNAYQSWQDSNTDTITTSQALYSDTNTNPVVGVEFCLSKTSSPTSSSIIATASCAVICDGRRGAEGATGKMFYPMGNYDPTVTYTRTGDLVPLVFYTKGDKTDWNAALECYGNYYYLKSGFDSTVGVPPSDDSSNPWQEASSFGVVITQGLFAEFAKLGKGIFSGDYLFSMNGELDSSDYNEGALWKGYIAYTLFRGDPSVKGISVEDGTVLTNSGYKSMVSSGIYLDSGEECVIKLKILDGTTSSNLIHVSAPSGGQIQFGRWNYASTWSTAYEMAVSSGNTYYIRFTASASGTYFISGGRNSSGTSADKIVYHLNRILFKPNWWVDLLTGKMSAARGNFVVDADGSVVATNGTFDGLLRARSMETMFADLTDKYRKVNNTYVALNGDSGSQGEYILGEDVYEMVGNSYVKVDITGIYNFVVGNTTFILPSDSAFISQRVLLFNGNVKTAGGTSRGVTVETYEIEGGQTKARYLRGVGKDVKCGTDTSVPSNHVLPSDTAVPMWSFDPVSRLYFVNGAVELIAVPDTEDATLCEWAVVNIGTNCYLLD